MRVASLVPLLFAAAGFASASADEIVAVERSGALPFMHRAEKVYVFPVTTPMEPHRDDKHLRLLGHEAAHSIGTAARPGAKLV